MEIGGAEFAVTPHGLNPGTLVEGSFFDFDGGDTP
jgi:hypothetical protein